MILVWSADVLPEMNLHEEERSETILHVEEVFVETTGRLYSFWESHDMYLLLPYVISKKEAEPYWFNQFQ